MENGWEIGSSKLLYIQKVLLLTIKNREENSRVKEENVIASDVNVNELIQNYPYVHLMYNDKFCKPVILFLNKSFSVKDHLFIVQKQMEFEIPVCDNVVIIGTLDDVCLEYSNIKKVICHSLFISGIFKYWMANQSVQREKAYWLIFGGDLYDAPSDDVAITVRKNFRGYISVAADGDCDVVKNKYSLEGKEYYRAIYAGPTDRSWDVIKKYHTKKLSNNRIRIQVNNSCDGSTIDMLKQLSVYSDKDIEVCTVLSYGNLEYKDSIIKCGKELFGERFLWLEEFVESDAYLAWIQQNDIFVLNQNRQQGVGNAIAALALGKKLYIKSNITTYSHLSSLGIRVFDSNRISEESFEEFISYDDRIKESNINHVKILYDDEYRKKRWESIFK